MGSKNGWPDVRLLSFDLQTVEFTYAADYAVALTCSDPLSPRGGSYDLHFTRTSADPQQHETNPHEDMEPLLRHVLRHDQLARTLLRLVDVLRDTLPIVLAMDGVRADAREHAGKGGPTVDAFAKGPGWYRILYGDARYMEPSHPLVIWLIHFSGTRSTSGCSRSTVSLFWMVRTRYTVTLSPHPAHSVYVPCLGLRTSCKR